MKEQIFKVILGLGWILILCSFQSRKPTGPLFWEVEKKGKTFHILGTIHFKIPVENIPCSKNILNHLNSSKFLLTESSLEINKAAFSILRTLHYSLSGEAFRSLSEESKIFFRNKLPQSQSQGEQGLRYSQLNHLSYYGLNSIIEGLCELDNSNFVNSLEKHSHQASGPILDQQIVNIAQSQGIPQGYMDEVEDILQIYAPREEDLDDHGVNESIKNYDKRCNKKEFEKRKLHFIKMDKDKMKKYLSGEEIVMKDYFHRLKDYDKEVKRINQVLFKNRNEKWISKILQSHNRYDKVFIVAGFLHFTGKNNILDMLKKRGYSIKQFNTSCKVKPKKEQPLLAKPKGQMYSNHFLQMR